MRCHALGPEHDQPAGSLPRHALISVRALAIIEYSRRVTAVHVKRRYFIITHPCLKRGNSLQHPPVSSASKSRALPDHARPARAAAARSGSAIPAASRRCPPYSFLRRLAGNTPARGVSSVTIPFPRPAASVSRQRRSPSSYGMPIQRPKAMRLRPCVDASVAGCDANVVERRAARVTHHLSTTRASVAAFGQVARVSICIRAASDEPSHAARFDQVRCRG